MNLYTHGGLYYPDRWIPIKLNNCEMFGELETVEDRFKLIIINSGTAILMMGEKRISIISPAVLCVNEKEVISIEKVSTLMQNHFILILSLLIVILILKKYVGLKRIFH